MFFKIWKILFSLFLIIFLFKREQTFKKEEINKDNITLITSVKNKTIIPISLALNHGYVNPTVVSMTSICLNAKPSTYYELYLLVPDDFTTEDSLKLLTVKERNPNSCNVTIINMKEAFKNAKLGYRIPPASYYRLSTPSLFKQYDRILYVDGDTVILGDLTGMYNLDLEDNYALGFVGGWESDFKPFNITNFRVMICAGVLLINLEKMRKDNFEEKINDLIANHKEKLKWHDQTALNIAGVNKLGLLAPKYGIFDFKGIDKALDFYNGRKRNGKIFYDYGRYMRAYIDPKLIHYNAMPKPWKPGAKAGLINYFWYYAKKSSVYNEIYSDYLEAKKQKLKDFLEKKEKKRKKENGK